jgi:hypothetical protein
LVIDPASYPSKLLTVNISSHQMLFGIKIEAHLQRPAPMLPSASPVWHALTYGLDALPDHAQGWRGNVAAGYNRTVYFRTLGGAGQWQNCISGIRR